MELRADTTTWLENWRLMLLWAHTQYVDALHEPDFTYQEAAADRIYYFKHFASIHEERRANRLYEEHMSHTFELYTNTVTAYMLKELSDDALMELGHLIPQLDESLEAWPCPSGLVVYEEAWTRARHACSILRRWRKPADCRKWREYMESRHMRGYHHYNGWTRRVDSPVWEWMLTTQATISEIDERWRPIANWEATQNEKWAAKSSPPAKRRRGSRHRR